MQIEALTDWNYVASIKSLSDDECAFRRASFSVRWDIGELCIQEDLGMDTQMAWPVSASLEFSGTGPPSGAGDFQLDIRWITEFR